MKWWGGALVGLLAVVTVFALSFWEQWRGEDLSFWEQWRGEDSLGAAVRNIALILGSIVALGLAVWRSYVAQQQLNYQQRSLLNDRYQRAAEMLGNEAMPVRLGGIDALTRLAEEQPQNYHVQVMSLFCAFVRHPPRPSMAADDGNVTEDVRAILRSMQWRNSTLVKIEKEADYRINLRGALLYGANLKGAIMSKALLSGTDLTRANLISAKLDGANLDGANLTEAQLGLANFRDARLGADLSRADLTGAILEGAVLRGCKGLVQIQLDSVRRTERRPELKGVGDGGKELVWKRIEGPRVQVVVDTHFE